MSFDLYFCWKREQRLDFEEVARWAIKTGNFSQKPDQLWYQNDQTGVYFSLDFEEFEEEDKSDENERPFIPAGFFHSGLSFNLNFNRPSYFGHEAMPIVEELCSRFHLLAFDPQADEDGMLEQPAKETLLQSWLSHNEQATKALVNQEGFEAAPVMPLRDSLYLWAYSKDKADLQQAIGEDIFVPSLVPLRRKTSSQADTAFVCVVGIPTIVPHSQWVFIVREKKKKLGGTKKELGIITAATFDGAVGQYLEPFPNVTPEVRLLGEKSVAPATKILMSLDRMLPGNDFEQLARDGFVDMDFPTPPRPA